MEATLGGIRLEMQNPFQMAALRETFYNSVAQLKSSPSLKKMVAITALGAVSLIFLARHFKRRRGKKKSKGPPAWEPGRLLLESTKKAASEKGSSCSGSRQNLALSLSSAKGSHFRTNGELCAKYSGSAQSLASVRSMNSCPSCACTNAASWDKADEEDWKLGNIPVTTPENLYLMGMDLFEEALRRWEQALTFRSRQAEDEGGCGSIKLGAGDAIAEENMEDVISAEFIHKLEALLQRAYRLQEEFEATLGASDSASMANDIDKETDVTATESGEYLGARDTLSVASTDSFVSAAEKRESRPPWSLDSLSRSPLYEEAMSLAEEEQIHCRALRTEMLECLSDTDFLAKLHCLRQAFRVIISQAENRIFLADLGRKALSALIVKARKKPKRFEDVYDQMMRYLERPEVWTDVEEELCGRGVKNINFYDIVLDFILMDSFEDLENPPLSIQNIVKNRWLNNSFKETAVASSCYSVLKQKRQLMKRPDGFFAGFYAVCEQICPVLVWGFLGPKNSFHDLCCFYRDQLLCFLKDIFDFEKVRYSSVECLSGDIMARLHHRTELLAVYLGSDSAKSASIKSRESQQPDGRPE
ncbi:mitoguardin 1 isoform X2 [Spea bombifrons]|uniref:mitoguardin 1 isoform X2 n=1 Tax=Spea bombifrons TaxID=233779 RepID=UPI00234A420C|nr:mitoguardin 1 isoform X2 [Spea bombifrons]